MKENHTEEKFNNEKELYKSLIDLHDRSFKFIGTLFTFTAAIVLFMTFSSIRDLQASLNNEKNNLLAASEQTRKDVEAKAQAMEKRVNDIITKADEDVIRAENRAISEIASVRDDAKIIAQRESQEKVTEAFEQKNIQRLVETTAEAKLGPELDILVNKQVNKATKSFDQQIEQLSQITIAESLIKNNIVRGMVSLDSIRHFASIPSSRSVAQKLINRYIESFRNEYKNEPLDWFWFIQSVESIKNTKDESKIVPYLYKAAYQGRGLQDSNYINSDDISVAAKAFISLNIMTDGEVKIFDYIGLNSWYRQFMANPHKLRLK